MSLLNSILYGLISGLTEFLPVSSLSHQTILMRLMGESQTDPIRDLLIHIAAILALLTACRPMLSRLQRERRLTRSRRRSSSYAASDLYDLRLVRTATVPLIICSLLMISTAHMRSSLVYTALFTLINGIILIIPEYIRQGNKDGRNMTGLDGIILGLCSSVNILPGISRIAAVHAYAAARGADRRHGLNWALLLSVPSLILLCVFDIVGIFTAVVGPITFLVLVGYILSALSAFFAGYAAIMIVQFLTVRSGFSGFAYYSLGVSLFSLILYLIA